jgi:carboxyl-terminal processing protease
MRSMRSSGLFAAASLLWALALGCTSPPSTTGPQSRSATSEPAPLAGPADELPELPADAREKVLAEMTAVLLSEKHLLRRAIDDTLSKQSFPKYLEQLDGAKLLLLEQHVAALSKYADRMDDELRERDLVLARKGGALVVQRRKLAAKLVGEILAKPFDFEVAEEVETDPKKLAFCQTEAELRDRWRRALKLQALERIQQMEEISAKKDEAKDEDEPPGPELDPLSIPASFEGREEKARKDIATRYQTRFARLESLDSLEPASLFLNALASAVDPHTQYLAPAEKANFDIAISGTLEGIGAVLGEQDHYIVVRELVPGGASWKQGRLEAGDLIIAVGQAGKPAVDVTDMPIDKVVQMIRGPKGTVVTLTVKKPDGKIESISITRDVIEVEATYARGAALDLGPKHDPMGYVQLPGFYGDIGSGKSRSKERNATDDVRALLSEFEKRKLAGVIIDLRGNGGGLLSHARDISGLFLSRGPVVQTRDASGKIGILADSDPGVAFTGHVVVLVDRFSASAAEILAAALQDYGRAVIVGTGPTHGKGTVQAVVDLDHLLEKPGREPLGVFKLTIEQYFRVTGGSVQWKGVTPDIVLPDPAAFVDSGERTLPHSIPWTSVGALPHTRHTGRWALTELVAASRDRLKDHAVFDKVDAFSKLLKARRDDTRASLERQTWITKRKRDKELFEAADPKLKQLSPLLEIEAIPKAAAPPPQPDKRLRRKLDSWKDELARDPWVAESLQVLSDMAKKK